MQTDPGASGLHPQVNGKFRKILDVLPWERHSKSTRTQDGTKWLSTSSSDVACQTHGRECSLQQLLLTGEDEMFHNQKTRAAGAAATKYHRWGGWDNRHCVCHVLEAGSLRPRCGQGVSRRPLSLACRWPSSPCALTWSPPCVCPA